MIDANFILDWWLQKHSTRIIEFIAINVEFEELSPEALEIKRKVLLLEYLDECGSSLLLYLTQTIEDFFDKLYAAIYAAPKKTTEGGQEHGVSTDPSL